MAEQEAASAAAAPPPPPEPEAELKTTTPLTTAAEAAPSDPNPNPAPAPAKGATGSSTSTDSSAADAARAKREARKAKILARGTDRLARITQAGRGQEGSQLYEASPTPSRSSLPSHDETTTYARRSSPAPSPLKNNKNASTTRQRTPSDDVSFGLVPPNDHSARSADGAPTHPRVGPVAATEPDSDDPLQSFMRALQAQMPPDAQRQAGAGAGSGAGPGFGPSGPGGVPSGFDPSAFMGAGGAGGGAGSQDPFAALMAQMQAMQAGGGRGAPGAAVNNKTWLDHALAWIHLVAILVFAFLTFGAAVTAHWGPTPTINEGAVTAEWHQPRSILSAWGRLAYRPPDPSDLGAFNLGMHMPLQQIPLFTLFVTLEIILQSGRIVALKRRPAAPSGLVMNLVRQLPIPALQMAVQTGSQYWSLISSLLDDIAVLVVILGLAIIAASWRADL